MLLSRGWNEPNLGDFEPSLIRNLRAQMDPPTQYCSVVRVRFPYSIACLECHSNFVKPLSASLMPHSGRYLKVPSATSFMTQSG